MEVGSNGWKNYLQDFQAQCYPYAVGLHPYDLELYTGATRQAAVDALVYNIQSLFDQADSMVTTPVWVTETGCGSQPPFGNQGQADALVRLVGTNGVFAHSSKCEGAIIHWLAGLVTEPQPFPNFTTLETTFGLPYKQPTQYYLNANWAGAP